ncbi:MAG: dihydrofolate reductase [Bacteroidetes bacterium]|nr:dihydrofolate reductase [Bacteroidota bacterium]
MSSHCISAIAAVGKGLELGAGNDLLWHLPDDFSWFVQHTRGKPVIMGRKTMQSLGKPLKNRLNIVITRNPESVQEGFYGTDSLENALEYAKSQYNDEIFIIGGGEIYKQSLDLLDKLYITEVEGNFPEADTFFPDFDKSLWKETFREHHRVDEKHQYAFDFVILEKIHA